MATINATNPTLQDIISRTKPGGGIDEIVELLSRENAALKDATWTEGNLPTGHIFTSRRNLPAGTWRRFNEGVAPTKSRTGQVTESCGMLTAMSKVDVDLAKLNGDEAAFRASEDKAFMSGLSNDLETALFYSSTKTDPEKIMGFAPRLDLTTGPWGGQIIVSSIAQSGSDQSSMWCCDWSPETVSMIYPKGSNSGGLEQFDGGRQLTNDANSNQFWAWVTSWTWKVGLMVRDARHLVRLCGIDTSAIAATGKLLINDMVKMVKQMHPTVKGRRVIYCNRKIETFLQLQAMDTFAANPIVITQVGGQPVTTFLGIPVRVTDAILNTEAIVS